MTVLIAVGTQVMQGLATSFVLARKFTMFQHEFAEMTTVGRPILASVRAFAF